jgi:hypothetical protein
MDAGVVRRSCCRDDRDPQYHCLPRAEYLGADARVEGHGVSGAVLHLLAAGNRLDMVSCCLLPNEEWTRVELVDIMMLIT